ncbi:hypothetical protein [Nevskia soli]|uniref:hypothetical protein n=1 Tax=Nevskia soli TaxID=418856 RepID=UPI000A01B296|nr:hypothetical protein [Nevskia soli]
MLLAVASPLAPAQTPPASPAGAAAYDPFSAAAAEKLIGNVEAGVPPQCYTRTGANSNPCWTCHTSRNGRNQTDDWRLQQRYDFSDLGRTNHWTNLFQDRRAAIAGIGDAEALAYIRQDNYAALRPALLAQAGYQGWVPDLDYRQGFDAEGFARDGSDWRAFRYKPFPGTFWPTNGSTDDVLIRLPARFRTDAAGHPSRAVYKANLAILEAAMAVPDTVPDARLSRGIEPIDEAAAGIDLDGDGRIGGSVSRIRGLPAHYAGGGAGEAVLRYDYPQGTEFLHTVRYIDPDAPELMSARFKEVRYAIKRFRLNEQTRQWRYDEEAQERDIGGLPHYSGTSYSGQTNAFGWRLQGYIEDAAGRLRLQSREEQIYCMGCHTGIGVTVDQTFSLPRKVPGAAGWGPQSLAGIQDVPQAGSKEPEILRYLRRVGGGDEFRANAEMLERYFPRGKLDTAKVRRAAPGGKGDIRDLITPSRSRALQLDKAYMLIVREQSFIHGRDALLAPAANVHAQLDNTDTALKASDRVYRDGKLWLDWDALRTNTQRAGH